MSDDTTAARQLFDVRGARLALCSAEALSHVRHASRKYIRSDAMRRFCLESSGTSASQRYAEPKS